MRQLPDELVVYDLERHEAHCLNRTAALVFGAADGCASVRDIARTLRRELSAPDADRLAWLALARLDRAHLLDAAPKPPLGAAGPGRREVLRRVGLAAALLPAVSSILAPSAAEAFNTCIPAGGCASKPDLTPCYNSNVSDCGTLCACSGGLCVDGQGTGTDLCP